MPRFSHDGLEFHYQSIGAGRPFVFCHGLTGDLEHPKALLAQPPPEWQLILWDCRYHGLTGPDRPDEDLSFGNLAKDLAALMEHLGIRSSVVGGVSMGAGVAARFAADHPDRTEALVLVRPAWTDQPHPPNLRLAEQVGHALRDVDGAELLRRFEADPALLPAAAHSRDAAESVRQLCIKPQARERSLRLRAVPAGAPVPHAELARLTMPALVVGNEHDNIHPMSTAHWWVSELGARAVFAEVPSKSLDLAAHEASTRRHVWQFLQSLPTAMRVSV